MPEIEWSDRVEEADWILEHLHPFGQDVGSVIPEGFEAYARLLHAPFMYDATTRSWYSTRWRDIARQAGRQMHPLVQWRGIFAPAGHPWDEGGPMAMPRGEMEHLVELLRDESATPDECCFCVWVGFGGLSDVWVWESQGGGASVRRREEGIVPRRLQDGPLVEIPNRGYFLCRGPVEGALSLQGYGPNMWWPRDRAWFVATELDHAWTYVGGPATLIAEILDDDHFEALPAQIADPITDDSDEINR